MYQYNVSTYVPQCIPAIIIMRIYVYTPYREHTHRAYPLPFWLRSLFDSANLCDSPASAKLLRR